MRVGTVLHENQKKIVFFTGKGLVPLTSLTTQPLAYTTLDDALQTQDGQNLLHTLWSKLAHTNMDSVLIHETDVQFCSPLSEPEKLICVGLNYRRHAEETKMAIPEYPILFSKFNNALVGHKAKVMKPDSTKQMDYEAELVIVMGQECRNVSVESALDYVFGYASGNDLSARDLQFRTGQWLLGKFLPGFAPLGPYIASQDEIPNPNALSIELYLNGELRQHSNTDNMIFNCAEIISYLSTFITLKPGDLIYTGTPEGVIMGRDTAHQDWLKPGDQMTVKIEGLGELVTDVL